MPGENCSIYGCTVSRSSKYKGIGIYKVPGGNNEFDTAWRNKLVAIITKNRVVDKALKDRIEKKRVYICQRHYRTDQISCHESRTSVIPGEIPEMNLPLKSFESSSTSTTTRRNSADSIVQKKLEYFGNIIETPSLCYKSFDEFTKRINLLKLSNSWTISFFETSVKISCMDDTHITPHFEVFVDNHLKFVVRVYLWELPEQHDIYNLCNHSFENITLSNLISILQSYCLCPGVSANQLVDISAFTQHVVPKHFVPSFAAGSMKTPLCQSTFLRSPSCHILLKESLPCSLCTSLVKRERLSLKRKSENILVPAKLNAPIKFTSSERVKLTLQDIRFENKVLKADIKLMKAEITNNNIPVDEELDTDLRNIMSTNDLPPFMKFFWEEQQKYVSVSNKKGLRYHPAIIRYCLNLASKSPAAYDSMRFDENSQSGFLVLPSRRRLRDYKNYIRPERGFNPLIVKELSKLVANYSDQERYVTILPH